MRKLRLTTTQWVYIYSQLPQPSVALRDMGPDVRYLVMVPNEGILLEEMEGGDVTEDREVETVQFALKRNSFFISWEPVQSIEIIPHNPNT